MYSEKVYGITVDGTPGAVDLTSAAVAAPNWLFMSRIQVRRIGLLMKVASVSTGSIVVRFLQRVLPGSSVGQVVLGTLTIPTGVAIGKLYYKDITPVSVGAGDQIVVEVTTAAAGGSAAGQAWALFAGEDDPETAANESDMVASA